MINKKLLTFIILLAFLFCFTATINAECIHDKTFYVRIINNSVEHEVWCTSCGIFLTRGSHSFTYTAIDATAHNSKCSLCGYIGNTESHYSPSVWNFFNPENHCKRCNQCNYIFETRSHTLNYNRTECTICHYTGPFGGTQRIILEQNK